MALIARHASFCQFDDEIDLHEDWNYDHDDDREESRGHGHGHGRTGVKKANERSVDYDCRIDAGDSVYLNSCVVAGHWAQIA